MIDKRVEAAAKVICLELNGTIFRDADNNEQEEAIFLATAALSASDAAAWQPIETAPRDGTLVDLWLIDCDGKGRRMSDAYFGKIPHECGMMGRYCDCCPDDGEFWIDGIFGERHSGNITHWRPLPEPPYDATP